MFLNVFATRIFDAIKPVDESAWRPILGALNLVALVFFIGLVVAWGRHVGRRRIAVSGLVVVSVIVIAFLRYVHSSAIPIAWVTSLHHGFEQQNILNLYAGGAHAGINFPFIVRIVSAGHTAGIRDVVWLNLLLSLVDAAIFFHIALRITSPAWAAAWTLVLALNGASFLASFSELPTHLLGLYFLVGVIAWTVLTDALPQPRVIRAMALCSLLALTLLAGLTRPEIAFIGVVGVTIYAGDSLLGSEFWPRVWERLRARCERPVEYLASHPFAVVMLCLAGVVLCRTGLPGDVIGRGEFSVLYPLNPSIVELFAYLPMLLLPLGASIATLLGLIYATLHFRRFGGLALSLVVLVRLYFGSWSQFFEMGRYLGYALPAIFFLGLFGKTCLDEFTARRLSPTWRRIVQIGYLTMWFSVPLPGVVETYLRLDFDRAGGFSQLLLNRDNQQEVRYLLELTEKNPSCVFVARAIDGSRFAKSAVQYDYVLFGEPLGGSITVPAKDASLDDVIAQRANGASCVRLYSGSDCNLNFTDHCERFVAGHHLSDERRIRSQPYNSPIESGYGGPEMVFATYEWR